MTGYTNLQSMTTTQYFTTPEAESLGLKLKIATKVGATTTIMRAYKGRKRAPEHDGEYPTYALARVGNNPFNEGMEVLIN
jgi:hypothetical protein